MKHFTLLAIIMLLFGSSYSQSIAAGYYITQKNDTVAAKIKIRKGASGSITNDFTKEVEVLDSINGVIKYTPDDIKGYGFSDNGTRYTFASKPVNNGTYKFLQPVYIGPISSLYMYGEFSGAGYATSSNKVFYTFEKAGGKYLFLRNILNKKFKNQLKEFYNDNEEVKQLIDTKLRYWLDMQTDLRQILIVANKS